MRPPGQLGKSHGLPTKRRPYRPGEPRMTWAVPTNVCLPTRASRPDTQRTKRSPQHALPATHSHRSGRVNYFRLCRRSLGDLASDSAYDHENSASVFASWHHHARVPRAHFGMTVKSADQMEVPHRCTHPARRNGVPVGDGGSISHACSQGHGKVPSPNWLCPGGHWWV
jgi:hypothetical protein